MTTQRLKQTVDGYSGTDLWDSRRVAEWQDFQLSGMPDLLSAMHLCHALLALSESGILERLRKGIHRIDDGLLDETNRPLAQNFLQYLTLRGVLTEWGGSYALTRRGELLTAEVPLARLGFYLEAYGPVVRETTGLVTGSVRYGRDVRRHGGALSRHCATVFTRYYTSIIVEAMQSRTVRRPLDLGCGAGQLLIDACLRDPGMHGIGLDISPDAIAVAEELAREAGVADRVSFVVADAFDSSTWPEICFSADALYSVGVLHEKFRDGEDAVVRILGQLATSLGDNTTLLIGEPVLRYDDRENDSDFYLVHALTEQGIPRNRSEWLRVIGRSDLVCRQIFTSAVGPRMCFFDLTPRPVDDGDPTFAGDPR